ncbi:GNAT family N-acetyltransferase [Methanospirillum sp.]|uniref:GNAT family N-acetyltransferase n=1 Tax=Methanospirillum sp. TaxID=45200 RepID=UPI00261F2212|nr:GNAT family N-acetyltransferase [Methanospirillum sp.]
MNTLTTLIFMDILFSTRLELVPITVELCNADLASHELLGKNLNARIPESWPPALVTRETLGEFIALLTASGGIRLYAWYWIRVGPSPDERILVGSGGFVRGEDNILELGYSVLDEFQCQGYATEAVKIMISWAENDLRVGFIKACTFPELTGSIKVLERTGFSYVGEGDEEGSLAYSKTP